MDVFEQAFRRAAAYRAGVSDQKVRPERSYRQMRTIFAAPLPEVGSPANEVIQELADLGEQGLMHTTHPGFFGWVIGGSAPVAVAADWLAAAWGQNAAMHASSPTAAAVEETAAGWLLEIMDLPRDAAVGFVSGATMGSFTALAAARGALLSRQGWDVEAQGLFGAPGVHVFAGEDVHTSILSALRYLGFGAQRVIRVETDRQGRMLADDLARKCGSTQGAKLIIAQAGQINTGAFDPFVAIADIAQDNKAWLHVDGAFGLWARADPDLCALTEGIERADSWVVDGHKWLQVPFDSGYAIVRDHGTARIMLERAIALDPNSAWALSRLGWLEVYADRPEAAFEHFEHAMRLSPLDPMNFNNLVGIASAHQISGDYVASANLFERALMERPHAFWIHRNLAPVLLAAGRAEDAEVSKNVMLKAYPDMTVKRYKAAMVFSAQALESIAVYLRKLGIIGRAAGSSAVASAAYGAARIC